MADPVCFIEPFGICISQSNAVSGALVAAMASILTTAGKLWLDYRTSSDRAAFEKNERENRQAFEKAERSARQSFEAQQTAAQRTFSWSNRGRRPSCRHSIKRSWSHTSSLRNGARSLGNGLELAQRAPAIFLRRSNEVWSPWSTMAPTTLT